MRQQIVLVVDCRRMAFFGKGTIRPSPKVSWLERCHRSKVEDEGDEFDWLLHAAPYFLGFFSAIAAYLV
jgi:hypothetical protein